jgi:hypothetical protein
MNDMDFDGFGGGDDEPSREDFSHDEIEEAAVRRLSGRNKVRLDREGRIRPQKEKRKKVA